MRVAIAAPFPEREGRVDGGVEAVISSLSEALARRGDVEVHVLSLNVGRPARFESPAGVVVHRVPVRRRFCASTRYFVEAIRMRRLIRAIAPDLLHPHNTSVYARVVLPIPLPLVLQPHGIMYKEVALERAAYRVLRGRLANWDERRVLARARNVILSNRYVADAYGDLLDGKRIWTVPNPVPDAFFDVRCPEQSDLLLFAGRLIPRKGVHHLIEAIRVLRRAGVPCRLRILGPEVDEEYVHELRGRVRAHRLADRVDFRGMVPQEEVQESFASCRALVLPSIEETAPMVIAQAQAAGKPVVATECAGIPETVGPGGTLVPYGDVDALARALRTVLETGPPVDAATIRRHADARHRSDAVAARIVDVYREVLAGSDVP